MPKARPCGWPRQPRGGGRTSVQSRGRPDAAACQGHRRRCSPRPRPRSGTGFSAGYRPDRCTSAPGFSASSGTRKSGLPVMPSEVVLTTVAASSSMFPAWTHSWTMTLAPKSGRRASARGRVRLARRISGTPTSIRAAMTARAAPPAPSTTAGPAAGAQCGAFWRRLAMKPEPSVLSAWILPSLRKISVLAAPISAARSVTISASCRMASLCGMVTFSRRSPARAGCGAASGRSSGAMSIGM